MMLADGPSWGGTCAVSWVLDVGALPVFWKVLVWTLQDLHLPGVCLRRVTSIPRRAAGQGCDGPSPVMCSSSTDSS